MVAVWSNFKPKDFPVHVAVSQVVQKAGQLLYTLLLKRFFRQR